SQALGNKTVDKIVVTKKERGHDADLIKTTENTPDVEIIQKKSGTIFKLPDGVLAYITDKIETKEIKEYKADTIVFAEHKQTEKIITKLKPRLAILTCYDEEMHKKNPVYIARELKQKTGAQTISAEDGLIVELYAYSAISEQKALSKFTENKQ
ncbi:hypothetical protein KY309_02860, partial [Candidatus Woesearchaeota archaeon]|nr:hypothetical protein [Candidatus Woesearchaeota archaeon]